MLNYPCCSELFNHDFSLGPRTTTSLASCYLPPPTSTFSAAMKRRAGGKAAQTHCGDPSRVQRPCTDLGMKRFTRNHQARTAEDPFVGLRSWKSSEQHW